MPTIKKSGISIITILFGLALIALALFAVRLGLSRNTGWGGVRILILVIGILIILSVAVLHFVISKFGRIYFLASLLGLLVIALYVWFATVGYWTKWPETTNYYDLQATAFRHGQLALQLKPDPALLAMPDPYDVQARRAQPGLSYLFDGFFYQGKYYLYWGPVPAVILALIKFIQPVAIGDQFLVFVYVSGLFIFQSLLVLFIWRRFFQNLPPWTILLGIALVGLASPLTWLINQPEIYEASIAAGQYLLVGGL